VQNNPKKQAMSFSYENSFKINLSHCIHMDYFKEVFNVLGHESCNEVVVNESTESSQISSKISSFVFRR